MLRPAVLLASRPGPATLVTAETCTSKLSPPESPHGRVVYNYAANWTPAAVELTSTGKVLLWAASWLPRHYPGSSLLRTLPPPSRLPPISQDRWLYDVPCSGDFAPGRGGFLQLLSVSVSPCCRSHPARGRRRCSQRAPPSVAFAVSRSARPLEFYTFGATCAFACATAW